jgi:hypothetical protein
MAKWLLPKVNTLLIIIKQNLSINLDRETEAYLAEIHYRMLPLIPHYEKIANKLSILE